MSETTGTGGGRGVTTVEGTVVVAFVVVLVGAGGRGTYVVAGGNGFDRMFALLVAAGTLWKKSKGAGFSPVHTKGPVVPSQYFSVSPLLRVTFPIPSF